MSISGRISIFIDGANLDRAQGRYQSGYKVDLVRLVERLVGNRRLVSVHYYGSQIGNKQTRFSRVRSVYQFQLHEIKLESRVDMNLALDMLDQAWRNAYDVAIMVSGDKHFVDVVMKVRDLGKYVEVVSFNNGLATSLRRVASNVIVLDLHANYIRMI